MAKSTSVIGILINIAKTGTGDKQAVASLKSLQAGLREAGAIFGTLAGVVYTLDKAYDATAGKALEYAGSVREVMNASGLGAEESSRLLQVTEDLGVSQEALVKSMRNVAKNGVTPTIEKLAEMASAYQNLEPGAARVKYLTDNFGKSGTDLARVLETDAQKLLAMNAAVSEGLVLNEQNIKAVEENALATENLKEKQEELAIAIGNQVIPVQTRLTDMTTDFVESLIAEEAGLFRVGKAFIDFAEKRVAKANAELNEGSDYFQRHRESAEAAAEGVDTLTEAEIDLRGEQALLKAAMSGDLKKAFDDYNDSMQELTKRSQSLLLEYQKLIEQGYAPTSEKVMEVRENMRATTDAIQDQNAQLRKSTTLMIFNNAAAHLDAKGQLALAKAFGLASIRDLEVAAAIEELTEKYQDQSGKIPTEKVEEYNRELQELRKRLLAIPPTVTSDVAVTYTYSGTPPPGGSCFLAGTRVHMADHSQRPIESVRVGEYVLTYDFTYGENVPARVREVFHHAPEETDRYLVINHDLRVTPNHRVYTSEGWKSAGDLRIGHEMILRSGEPYIVEQIDVVERRVAVYNLHVDHPDHNYYANEILVHNVKTDDSEGYAFGGVAQGPESGHWELLHGTELVMRPSQFASLLKMAAGQRSAGGGGMGVSFAGATFNVSLSGASSIGEFYQTIMDSAGRNL